jgi:phage baseplate assembly protein gpV
MNRLINGIRSVTEGVHGLSGVNRWGLVTSVMTSDRGYLVKVQLQPDGVTTGWIPVLSHFVGPGWGAACPPEPNMQAFIAPDMGNGEHPVVIGLSYSTQAAPPVPPNGFQQQNGAPVQPGEITFVSKAGAVLRLCSDGTIYIKAPVVNIEGNLVVQGDIRAEKGTIGDGDVYDRHGSLDRFRGHFNSHAHTGVKSGGETSSTTTIPDPE